MKREFYLRDTRSNVVSTCIFWAKDGCGYVSDVDKAEVFNFDEAQRYADEKHHFIPLSKMVVDSLATIRVDMQYLTLNTDFSKGIIIHRCVGNYDGNDIFFDNGYGGFTANYNEAKVYGINGSLDLANKSGVALSEAFLDTICRRTLQATNVNHRKMITNAGIKYRAPRTPRKTTGKTRGNCPECGKITWNYNPHENAYCAKHEPYYKLR